MSLRPLRPFAQFIGGVTESFDADAAAYIAAVETADGQALESAVKTAINDFVVGCKADASPNSGASNWSALKACCLTAGPRTLDGSIVPLVGAAPSNVGFTSGDFARATGLMTSGTKYLVTNRNNNADPQDNRHISVWVSDWNGTVLTRYVIGCASGVGASNLAGRSDRFTATISTQNVATSFATLVTGFLGATRTSSTEIVMFRAGAEVTISSVSESPASAILNAGRAGVTGPYTGRFSWYSIGEAVDLAALNSRLSSYMTAIAGIS